ncbi:50S ribosomal protein L21 [Haliangium sp.]|uniref:50S ribosomal protein L21 n=1 Tax=Haliangium sp. TaxID=2663208 RepID=UPI003D0FF91E
MYAVIQTGGKQYRVSAGQTVTVERLAGEVGDSVEFDDVRLVAKDGSVSVGTPQIEGAKVTGKIVEHGRGTKLIVYKFKRRKNYRRRNGHRQGFTTVEIGDVLA